MIGTTAIFAGTIGVDLPGLPKLCYWMCKDLERVNQQLQETAANWHYTLTAIDNAIANGDIEPDFIPSAFWGTITPPEQIPEHEPEPQLATDGAGERDGKGPTCATNNGGGVLPPPSVSDSKLQNLVNNLWKGTANSSPVGNGTTADAVRYERATGQPVGGKFHSIKAQETVNGLRNWMNNNPNASYSDRLVAQSLIDDLLDALNCVP